mmetsp:Transcript_619/g.1301  ORF Transcript_619/g.1301 Transcript_619/m.1301 type:complete len:282 (-) Transcript_619:282-1127(-)
MTRGGEGYGVQPQRAHHPTVGEDRARAYHHHVDSRHHGKYRSVRNHRGLHHARQRRQPLGELVPAKVGSSLRDDGREGALLGSFFQELKHRVGATERQNNLVAVNVLGALLCDHASDAVQLVDELVDGLDDVVLETPRVGGRRWAVGNAHVGDVGVHRERVEALLQQTREGARAHQPLHGGRGGAGGAQLAPLGRAERVLLLLLRVVVLVRVLRRRLLLLLLANEEQHATHHVADAELARLGCDEQLAHAAHGFAQRLRGAAVLTGHNLAQQLCGLTCNVN